MIDTSVAPVTVNVAVPDVPPKSAVMVLVPVATPVATPELLMVAVAVVPDVHDVKEEVVTSSVLLSE